MLSYATVGTNDVKKAEPFFNALFSPHGVTKMFDHPRGGVVFGKDGKLVLGVLAPFDGAAATVGNGAMVAIEMPSRDAVDACHAQALALGGTCEGTPGERGPGFYMAYFRDLDGNKFAVCKLG